MKQLQTVLLIAAVAALLTPLAFAQSSAPRIAVDHTWLETGARACLENAKGALTSAGFQDLVQEQTSVAGKTVMLAASISCIASGNRTLAGMTISGPANSGSSADLMRDHLRREKQRHPNRRSRHPQHIRTEDGSPRTGLQELTAR